MSRLTIRLAASLAVAASFSTPQSVEAQHRVRCESRNNQTQNCRIDNIDIDSIRPVSRLSQSACINETSWGAVPGAMAILGVYRLATRSS
jgi:hypothetical protein